MTDDRMPLGIFGPTMNRQLIRFGLCLALGFSLTLRGGAQVTVVVSDDLSGRPISYAHVTLDQLGKEQLRSATNDAGAAELNCTPSLAEPAFVRITFVGYETRQDTLTGPGVIAVRLQRKPFGLDEVVITGQYAPNTPEAAVHRVRVLDGSTFQRMAANNLGDALRNELNIRLAQDNVLGGSMSMQGMGGQNVKVLVDGIPVIGRQDGNIDLGQLDLSGIERAEIVEGPLSVSYGTNALAGTINLITRKAVGTKSSFQVGTYTEHIGRFNANFTASRSWGKHSLLLNGGRNFFAGWDPGRVHYFDFSPQLADTSRHQQWKPREQYFGRLNYRWTDRRWTLGYKGEVMYDMILARGMPRAPYLETAFDERFRTLRMDQALFAQAHLPQGLSFNGTLAYNRYNRIRNTWFRDLTTLEGVLTDASGAQDTSLFDLTNLRAVLSSAQDSTPLSWEVGADLVHEQGQGERIDDGRRSIGDHAVFASLEYRVTDRLTLRPGLRYGYNTRYKAPVIPSVNMRWRLGQSFTLRASYAEGFRAPSLKELYFFFVDVNHDISGNADLRAERSRHGNLSLVFRNVTEQRAYSSEINLFFNHLRDQIALAQIEGSRWSYVNVDELSTTGASMNAGRDDGRWAVSAGASLTARLDAIAVDRNEPWLWTPEVRGSLTRQWRDKGIAASFFWKFTGEQVNYAILNNVDLVRGSIAPYHMADLTISKRCFNGWVTVAAGCKDLFDVQNLNASLAGGVHNAGGTSVPMSTGRTAFLKVDLEWQRKRTP